MSQFGATAKNPPWVRTTAQTMATGVTQQQQQLQTQMMGQTAMVANPTMVQYQQPQQVFQTPMGMQQAGMTMTSMTGAMGATSVAMPTTLGGTQMFPQVATVSYPTPRALNPTAFQTAATVAAVPPVPPATPNPSPKQRVFTGTVTKVHDNFGFVDEDVFFQTSSCVKGSNPVVGDRVLVEASYNPNMPFKWNATRIQVLPMTGAPAARAQNTLPKGFSATAQNSYNAVPPPDENSGSSFGRSSRKASVGSGRRERSKERSREAEEDEAERKKRREERAREREEKEKRSPSVRRRSKSPRPAPRRRARIVPRYMVQIPKIALDMPEADVLELRRRYSNMYIPSDFFSTNFRWVDAFPPHNPFTLDQPCSFHVMNKEVDAVLENLAVLEPPDADYLFSAKVMLMSMPTMEEIFRKCCALAEDKESKDSSDDARDFVHPTRLVNFLVGLRGKNETMAVGGPWSPSLDGQNPDKDPSVLIKTAIRTCQALTGIDLSHCTQWYRFLEIYYRRGESTHKGRVVPARVETVVLFLPDVWSCVPTRLEWDGLHLNYKKQLERKLKADQDGTDGANADEKEGEENASEIKKEPTHFSELDPKGMKELEARTLSPKGLKSQLIARLTKAIKTEAEKAEEEEVKKGDDPEPVPKQELEDKDDEKKKKEVKEEEKRKQDERERIAREKRYALPESPHIVVHPSRTAKSGKFDCTVMSLSLLLDYRPEDTKEHSFEVSLFAELFNEMLMRDFGFRIYRALNDAPERAKEDEKDRKKERDKKDEKDKKDRKDDKRDDKKNGKKEDKDEKKEDKDRRDDSKSKSDEKEKEREKNEDKDDEDEEEDEDEEDEDSKDSKKEKERDDKDRKRDKDKDKKKKERVKLYTEDPHLLLAFVYFDQSHCGYIFDKDIEELLYTLGLNLSRAQVRKLVQKVVTRDSLHYRKLTDKPRAKEEDSKDSDRMKDAAKEKSKEKDPAAGEALAALAFGNKRLLPVFSAGGSPPSKRARKDPEDPPKDKPTVPDGFVLYKGGLLDVEKLMGQLKRSEKARTDTEHKMLILKEELTGLKETAAKSASTVKDLSLQLQDYKEKLRITDQDLVEIKMNAETYFATLREIQEKIAPVVNTGDIQVVQMDSRDMKEETSDVMVKHENQHESRWGDKVDHQDEKKKKVETIKSETAMECN
ncbi:cell division cycle and apoptosis regulator protein 1 isoform X3 [Cryptotermes secundus]|uniref:cell division cycle and apoptosis regulator protein 1 isoform X3 n=1 Tax=Cryptotermes secundus TaxID=105785 RepID=UPI000CD7D0ED|nr:cell division cycle and apoptosis regulator protein 1 isoform X3 [Cryptotermes secundus]